MLQSAITAGYITINLTFFQYFIRYLLLNDEWLKLMLSIYVQVEYKSVFVFNYFIKI